MRNFDRKDVRSKAVLLDYEQQNHLVFIFDFSQMGVGMVSDQKLIPKTFITLLYQNDTGSFIQMKAYVKHVRKIIQGKFFIGVQFIGIESKYKCS